MKLVGTDYKTFMSEELSKLSHTLDFHLDELVAFYKTNPRRVKRAIKDISKAIKKVMKEAYKAYKRTNNDMFMEVYNTLKNLHDNILDELKEIKRGALVREIFNVRTNMRSVLKNLSEKL